MPRKSRKIQLAAGLATLIAVALVVASMPGKLSRAARLQDQSKPVGAPPQDTAKPAVMPLEAEPVLAPQMPVELASEPPPPAAPNAAPVAAPSPDPEKAAEEFLARTRKEASDAVDALNAEAAQLRERLAKVEAGLARYKATLDALNAPPPAGTPERSVDREPVFRGGPQPEPGKGEAVPSPKTPEPAQGPPEAGRAEPASPPLPSSPFPEPPKS